MAGDPFRRTVRNLQILVWRIVRYEYLKDRLQETWVKRKRYMDKAELAILLSFVSAFVCGRLIVMSPVRPLLKEGHDTNLTVQ